MQDQRQKHKIALKVELSVATPGTIKSILLSDGWHNVSKCRFVQFAISEPHSPVVPERFWPALRYVDDKGRAVTTALSSIISYEYDDPELTSV